MSAPATPRIADSLRLFTEIVRFRKGPEDLPVSALLLGLAIGAGVLLRVLFSGILPMPGSVTGSPVLIIAVGIGVTLLYLAGLLRLAGHPERFLQTATATFGSQLILGPGLIFSGWFFVTHSADPTWRVPAALLALVFEIWALAVMARILRSATGWPIAACVALTIAGQLLIYLAVAGLFPQPPATPATP